MRGAPVLCLRISSESHLCHGSIAYSHWQNSEKFLISRMKICPSNRPATCALCSTVPFLTYAGGKRQQIGPGTCVKHKMVLFPDCRRKKERLKPETWVIHRMPPFPDFAEERKTTTINKALDHLPGGEVRIPGSAHPVHCTLCKETIGHKNQYQGSVSWWSPDEKMASSGVLSWSPNCQLKESQPQNRLVNTLLAVLLRTIAQEAVFQTALRNCSTAC